MSTRIGAGIVIKVMPGDTISISSQAWYTGSTQAPPTGLPAIADQLLTLISNGIVANGGTRRKHSREMQITGVSIMMDCKYPFCQTVGFRGGQANRPPGLYNIFTRGI